jgi:hypothetical protein
MKLLSHFRILILISLIALVTANVFAQTPSVGGPPPIGGYRSPSEDPNVGRRDNAQPRIDEMKRREDPMNNSTGPGSLRPDFVFKSESKLNAKERMLLATDPEDQKKYAEFLRQPGTGLFRLLPHEAKGIVTVENLKSGAGLLPIKGWGAYYSYSKLRHELDGWSEIGLQNGTFQVGFARRSLGFIGLLGDVPLEAVTLDSKEVDPLHKLVPATAYQEIMAQGDKNIHWLRAGGFIYGSTIAAFADNTYVLRSTTSGKADILVAFRVIRQDAEGSLHVLWKKLADYPVKTLKGKPKK